MFYAKATEMLHRDLYFLNKLEKIKEKERLAQELAVISSPFAFANAKPFNLALAN